jgi:uncharacterized protein YecE (DUF72 family)
LKDCQESLDNFLKRTFLLKEKLGPILFQMPPSFKGESERLKSFLEYFVKITDYPRVVASLRLRLPHNNNQLRAVFELRRQDCFREEIYQILKKYNIALCFADTPDYPYQEEETADFIYLRLHGHKKLYASCYSKAEIKKWAEKIKKWQAKGKDVYCYFDNDAQGFATKNALELSKDMNHEL